MKISIKYLAPYLPYRLNCYGQGEVVEDTIYDDNQINKLLTITGLDTDWVTVEGIRITMDESIMMEDCMPILRPLSYLTKEIELNGEKFVPLKKMGYNISWYGWNDYKINILEQKYSDVQKLIEWHFDIFGLIDEGLAIDINTLKL